MKKFKVTLIIMLFILVLSYLLYTISLLENRINVLEHSVGRINWDIEEAVREIGFLQLEIYKSELN